MRVTTRTRYAIRALYHLAFHRAGEATQAKEIADAQKIPLRFLEQILQDLRRAGLVETRRGPRGGYALARPPAEISLADVLRAVRGPLEELLGVGGSPRRCAGVDARRRRRTTCRRWSGVRSARASSTCSSSRRWPTSSPAPRPPGCGAPLAPPTMYFI